MRLREEKWIWLVDVGCKKNWEPSCLRWRASRRRVGRVASRERVNWWEGDGVWQGEEMGQEAVWAGEEAQQQERFASPKIGKELKRVLKTTSKAKRGFISLRYPEDIGCQKWESCRRVDRNLRRKRVAKMAQIADG